MTNGKHRITTIILASLLLAGSAYAKGYIDDLSHQLTESNNKLEQTLKVNEELTTTLDQNKAVIDNLSKKNDELIEEIDSLKSTKPSTTAKLTNLNYADTTDSQVFEATAYTDGGYTAEGFDLTGHSWDSAMIIAVDPRIIPLGTQVYIEFDGSWSVHNGVYTASDTGGAIKGHIVDIFVGHDEESLAMQFGRRNVRVTVL